MEDFQALIAFNNMLTEEIKSQIRKHALSEKPIEVCGLIIDINGKLETYPCKNISYHKDNHAILNPLDYVRASKIGKIIGHYHSHERKGTSLIDNLNAFNHKIFSIVYSWKWDKFYIIEPKLENYLNLPFNIGKNDCLELVRNYYKNELNIDINQYNRDENWAKLNPNVFLENFEKEGFYKVKLGNVKLHDIFIFNINKVPSHLAIYLENSFILHHPYDSDSIISELTEPLKKRINIIIRHKEMKYE